MYRHSALHALRRLTMRSMSDGDSRACSVDTPAGPWYQQEHAAVAVGQGAGTDDPPAVVDVEGHGETCGRRCDQRVEVDGVAMPPHHRRDRLEMAVLCV